MTSSKGENVRIIGDGTKQQGGQEQWKGNEMLPELETESVRARRDAILAETQADWDEGKVFEVTGVTPEARAQAEYQRLFGSRTGRHTHPVTHPLWLEFTDGDCVVCGVTPEAKREYDFVCAPTWHDELYGNGA
jgi:hypothetical protein